VERSKYRLEGNCTEEVERLFRRIFEINYAKRLNFS
jgi:hypothetical protein